METTISRYDRVFFFLHHILLTSLITLHCGFTYTWVTCSSTLSGHPSSSLTSIFKAFKGSPLSLRKGELSDRLNLLHASTLRIIPVFTASVHEGSESFQVIPCYNETVILSKQFLEDVTWHKSDKTHGFRKGQKLPRWWKNAEVNKLVAGKTSGKHVHLYSTTLVTCKEDGVNTNLGFIISQFPEERPVCKNSFCHCPQSRPFRSPFVINPCNSYFTGSAIAKYMTAAWKPLHLKLLYAKGVGNYPEVAVLLRATQLFREGVDPFGTHIWDAEFVTHDCQGLPWWLSYCVPFCWRMPQHTFYSYGVRTVPSSWHFGILASFCYVCVSVE